MMPKIRKFEMQYSLPKSFAHKCDLFELRFAIDLKTKEQRSVKIYRKCELSSMRMTYVKREMNLLRRLDHPNIVKIHDIIEDETKIYCIIDLIKGQSLFEYVIQQKQMSV